MPRKQRIRTTTHPAMFELMATNYTFVAGAPGVAVSAEPVDESESVLYTAVVTVNETPDYMEKARELLLEAEKMGFDGIAWENETWYNELGSGNGSKQRRVHNLPGPGGPQLYHDERVRR